MIKSLLVSIDFPPVKGGVSHSLWNFCNAFPSSDIIVLTQPTSYDVSAEYPIIRRHFFGKWFIWPRWLPLLWHVFCMIRQHNIKLLQVGQVLPVGTVALILRRLLNIPYVVYVYGQDLIISHGNSRKQHLIHRILRSAHGVVANSEYTKSLVTEMGIDPANVAVAYPSVPQYRHVAVSALDQESFRKQNDLEDAFVLLSVGNLVRRKGHDAVIAALSSQQVDTSHMRYCIVGDGPMRNELETRVQQLGLTDAVTFHGRVSDEELPLYFSVADVLIMPSRVLMNDRGRPVDVEGFGMVFLEANLYGKPVIAGRSGGVPEAVKDNVSGILVNPDDTSDIVRAIHTLRSNPALRTRLGEQGRDHAKNGFSLAKQIRHIMSILP